jgi:hypothetical protein
LSKGGAEPVEALVPRANGFDRLSPNGGERGFDKLSPNGSLRTLNVAFGPTKDTRVVVGNRFMSETKTGEAVASPLPVFLFSTAYFIQPFSL